METQKTETKKVENLFLERVRKPANARTLSKDASKIFMMAAMAELEGNQPNIPEEEMPFVAKVVQKRIEVFNLPIKFTNNAYITLLALTENNPGRGVTVLVDCLTKHSKEDETVTIDNQKLAQMYPHGFYSEEVFCDYVDNYLKPKKVKWSELY